MTDTPSIFRSEEASRDGSTEAPRAGGGASLLIRLWTLPRPEVNPVARDWREESGEVAMLADLVSACRGKLADGHKPHLTAEFPDLPTALMAARRMQQAMVGFASHQPRSRAAAAICLFSRLGEDTSSSTTAREDIQAAGMLMSAATACQVLLANAAYLEIMRTLPQTARGISSVQLESATGGPVLQAYELVWAEPETYVRLRKLVEGMEWAHATASHRGQQATTRLADPPQPTAAAGPSGSGSESHPPRFNAETAPPAKSKVWRRTWVVLGAAAAALITVTVLLTTKPDMGHFKPSDTVPPKTVNSVTEPPSGNPKPELPSAGSPNPLPNPENAETSIPAKMPEVPGKQNASDGQIHGDATSLPAPTPPPAPQPKTAPVRVGREPVEGFYRRDIPYLLDRADRESGNSKYGPAEYWYGIVLQLEPGNAKARLGLNRAIKAEELDQQ